LRIIPTTPDPDPIYRLVLKAIEEAPQQTKTAQTALDDAAQAANRPLEGRDRSAAVLVRWSRLRPASR